MIWNPKSARSRTFRSTITLAACGINVAFDFQDDLEALGQLAPSVAQSQQQEFIDLFRHELGKLEAWIISSGWQRPTDMPRINVHVSGIYRISRSLVLYWEGQPGLMEFSSFRVALGEAPIMHELVHIYFPNSNRFLAEGLAVWLQQEIGTNVTYPNFGVDFDWILRNELGSGLKSFRIEQLDRITTPTNLLMRVGRETIEENWTYLIAGSFIRFLVKEFSLETFKSLFSLTPLIPFQRDCGSARRWRDIYGMTLTELQNRWVSQILPSRRRSRKARHQ